MVRAVLLLTLAVFGASGVVAGLRDERNARELRRSGIVSPRTADLALSDEQGRIDRAFPVPDALREKVIFWMRIYSEFSSQEVVIYDRHHPALVYDVVDLREAARRAKNAVVFELESRQTVRRRVQAVRSTLIRLSKVPSAKRSSADRRIAELVARFGDGHSFAQLARGVRSQTGQRDFVVAGLALAQPYIGDIRDIFERRGLPAELIAISLVESSFNSRAHSRSGARGVWQFLERSAKEFLRVDRTLGIDERLSPLKASEAAAKLLAQNFRRFRNWPMAITAFHHGYRGLLRIPRNDWTPARAPIYLADCPIKVRALGWASRNYYAEFLAMTRVVAYRELFYGPSSVPLRSALKLVALPNRSTLEQVAAAARVPLSELLDLNPDIRSGQVPLPARFKVALPETAHAIGETVSMKGFNKTRRQ